MQRINSDILRDSNSDPADSTEHNTPLLRSFIFRHPFGIEVNIIYLNSQYVLSEIKAKLVNASVMQAS